MMTAPPPSSKIGRAVVAPIQLVILGPRSGIPILGDLPGAQA